MRPWTRSAHGADESHRQQPPRDLTRGPGPDLHDADESLWRQPSKDLARLGPRPRALVREVRSPNESTRHLGPDRQASRRADRSPGEAPRGDRPRPSQTEHQLAQPVGSDARLSHESAGSFTLLESARLRRRIKGGQLPLCPGSPSSQPSPQTILTALSCTLALPTLALSHFALLHSRTLLRILDPLSLCILAKTVSSPEGAKP